MAKKKAPKYDIFISYRRAGGDTLARNLQLALQNHGYNVFLDFDECDDGIFDTKLKAGIESAPIFILLLSKGALDRCCNADDWVRKEIEYAASLSKKIIPVNPDKVFTGFPENLPQHLQEIIGHNQISEIDRGQLFNSSINLLIEKRIAPIVPERSKQQGFKYLPYLIVAVLLAVATLSINNYYQYDLSHKEYITAIAKAETIAFQNEELLPTALQYLQQADSIERQYENSMYSKHFSLNAGQKLAILSDSINARFNYHMQEAAHAESSYKQGFHYLKGIILNHYKSAFNLKKENNIAIKIKEYEQ